MTRVAVLDDYKQRAHEFADWDSLGPGVAVSFFPEHMGESELPDALAPFEILVLMRERTALPRQVLERLPNLRLVITTGMHNAAVDAQCLGERGVVFAGAGSAGPRKAGVGGPVELAWGMILAIAKRIAIEDRAMRAGLWQTGMPVNLPGMTLGLAGLGNLGGQMVGPARAFGLDVIAWSPNLSEERADELAVRRVTKEQLLRESDILSIHLVLSERTRNLFGAPELALMKSSAMLINTSRGPIVDETALVGALRSGALGAAGLDVYDVEPLPSDHPLRSLDNVVIVPHLGYVSEFTFRTWYANAVEGIAAFLNGQPIRVIS